MGLAKAARRYHSERGHDFLAYAIRTIRQEIRRHVRDFGCVVRPPRRTRRLEARIRAAHGQLTEAAHRPPTIPELAGELDVPIDDLLEALLVEGCFASCALDPAAENGDAGSLAEHLGGSDGEFNRGEAMVLLGRALRRFGNPARPSGVPSGRRDD